MEKVRAFIIKITKGNLLNQKLRKNRAIKGRNEKAFIQS